MHNPNGLQHAEAAEGDQRNPLIALLPPHSQHLRHKRAAHCTPAPTRKSQRQSLSCRALHREIPALRAHPQISCTPRAFALAASSSRLLFGALVSSALNSRAEAAAISSTALRNAASLAFEGLLNPLTLRTNCSDAARISSSVTGGSKLKSILIFRHIS